MYIKTCSYYILHYSVPSLVLEADTIANSNSSFLSHCLDLGPVGSQEEFFTNADI